MKMISKLEGHKELYNKIKNKQWIENDRTTALERTQQQHKLLCVGGLNAFNWYQNFQLDSLVA